MEELILPKMKALRKSYNNKNLWYRLRDKPKVMELNRVLRSRTMHSGNLIYVRAVTADQWGKG